MVLDALNYIKDHLDGTLSYRWSCHMAVCGSCGMMINGEPKLVVPRLPARLSPRPDPGRAARPLPDRARPGDRHGRLHGQAVERQALSDPQAGEAARARANTCRRRRSSAPSSNTRMCINCLLCYAACPQCGLNRDFIGPAALALAHRYNLDSRDGGKDERADVVASNEGIWECTFVGACSEVCPKHVDPAAAIQQTKISASLDWFKASAAARRHA